MISYMDMNGFKVELTFKKEMFEMEKNHVLVVLKHEGKWLLTKHRERGVEFPGGKVEKPETLEEAAIRETLEETGVLIKNLVQVAEYVVHGDAPFCKTVFTGSITKIHSDYPLRETEGVVWMNDIELDSFPKLSFHMKDEGMTAIRKRVMTLEL
ncbi:NUDIX domain-containing protein [Sporosarcina sp. FA9]|uniref:NUDIX domain-containing protein n=1 Tax=Sporosarcina sp. FA9 TaxID=3413030 RepID=UPI003F65CFF0